MGEISSEISSEIYSIFWYFTGENSTFHLTQRRNTATAIAILTCVTKNPTHKDYGSRFKTSFGARPPEIPAIISR
ncbi:MAG: hypothetical protein NW217_16505 [Hyphomicrobiaceae bacterium]|nr:hypothetical protein [Hyphomicrobiaceae bacterium]